MITDLILVSKDLLDTSTIETSLDNKLKLSKFRDLGKAREHLSKSPSNSVLVTGYPLTPMTTHEHEDFISTVLQINRDFDHLIRCVVYGPHERMKQVLVDDKEIVCVARSIFFRDPIKWIIKSEA